MAYEWLELLEDIETAVKVGAGFENVTELESVAEVTAVPALPARSEKLIVNVTVPAVSELLAVYEDVQLLPEVLVVVTEPETATPPDLKVTVGVWIVSDEVNESMTVAPTLALVVLGPFDAIETVVNVGAVVSMTMFLLAPREPVAPGEGSVNVAFAPDDASLIVPPFRARAEVEA